ncbi:PAS domain S-box protein [Rhodanobacter sp. Col0626]|uniref:hybrid sensor histidine kinase/response regulator n=1 Tax=Rhodanobacter sp. Col0626 TaxID=3415679 RepID=UPI003CF5E780
MDVGERYRLLVESLEDVAIYMVGADGRIETWNRGAELLAGYSAEEAVGMALSALFPGEQQAAELTEARSAIRGGEDSRMVEGKLRCKDGSNIAVSITVQSVRDASGTLLGYAGTARDVSHRQATASAHEFTEEQFRRLVQGVIDYAIYMLDLDGHVHSWNSGAERIKGYRAEEIIGQHFSVFYTDSDRTAGEPQRGLAQAREHGRFENQAWRVRKDGSLFWAHVVIDRVDDNDGKPIGFAKVTRDATESRQAEEALEEMRRALHQSQKMEAIGQLTGGVAHDFNNLLQVISGNLQLLGEDVSGNDRARNRVANAMAGVARGSKLASQLLSFGRRQPLAPRIANPGKLIRDMDELLRHTLGEGIEIETVISGGLWNLSIDRMNLENAILNLSINARDAMDGRGRLTIEAGNAFLDDQYARIHHEVKPGQYVLIAVTDTGCGVPPDLIEKVFEPFFSTKSEGNGTGLGLSMVYGFVKQSGGHVKIYSEVGQGTTVKIYLPRSMETEEQPAAATVELMRGGTESILVVEDDEAVRDTAVSLLRNLGYSVLEAPDARSALSVVQSGVKLDLLFTDVVMPGPMRSPELAAKARERIPGLAVLFTSGYTENAIVHGGRLDEGVELLSKPYTQEALARKVREVLSARTKRTASESGRDSRDARAARLRILLCEDDASIRSTVKDMLESRGFSVVDAGSAEAAVHLYETQKIDLLVTDLSLPGTSGIELARNLRKSAPGLPVVFATGRFSDDLAFLDPRTKVLLKPYGAEVLFEAISQLTA